VRKQTGREVDEAADVDVDLLVCLLEHFIYFCAWRMDVQRKHNAGVVHEAVEVRMLRDQLVDERADRRHVADVKLDVEEIRVRDVILGFLQRRLGPAGNDNFLYPM
jgi:hypothetical protein